MIQLPARIRTQIITPSPFSGPVTTNVSWNRWDSGKHLIYLLCQAFSQMAAENNPRKNAQTAIAKLAKAVELHAAIQKSNVFLADNTNVYQANWKAAMEDVLKDRNDDFEYLDLLNQ